MHIYCYVHNLGLVQLHITVHYVVYTKPRTVTIMK